MIVLLRHGRTRSNASGLLLGRADPPLDAVGERQAELAAAALAASPDRSVRRIVSSPLVRTATTAAAVGAATGLDVEFDDRFLELDYGRWDERPLADVTAAEWAAWRADPSFAPPGGESLSELGVRVRAALEDLAGSASAGDVVVVTHVSPIKAAVAWALGVGDEIAWRMFVAPATVTTIAVDGRGPSLVGFNDDAHLTQS